MADEYTETFLQAEDQAVRLAAELERLSKALATYQAVADELTQSARVLGTLATEQRSSTEQLRTLGTELQRLGSGEFLKRLDAIGVATADVTSDAGRRAELLQGVIVSHNQNLQASLSTLETGTAAGFKQVSNAVTDVAAKVDGARGVATTQYDSNSERLETLKRLAEASAKQQTSLTNEVESIDRRLKELQELTTAVQTRITVAAGVVLLMLTGVAALILTRS